MRTLTLVVLLCGLVSLGAPTIDGIDSQPLIEQKRADLKLELTANRTLYRRKDDVSLKIMIINDSGVNAAFIFGDLGFGPRASFTLYRRDAKGREVPTRFFDDFHGDPSELSDATSFVKLRPGHYLGITYENSIYNLNLEKPGTYRLWVEYHSPVSASEVSVRPFWGTESGTIKSNVVEIRVRQ